MFMFYQKVYVRVVCEFLLSGGVRPLKLYWSDGKSYSIDRVKFIGTAPCLSGGVLPQRYTVIISGQQRYLYYEIKNQRWFVEIKV